MTTSKQKTLVHHWSAYLAFNIAEKRAAFVFRRFLALGFSNRR